MFKSSKRKVREKQRELLIELIETSLITINDLKKMVFEHYQTKDEATFDIVRIHCSNVICFLTSISIREHSNKIINSLEHEYIENLFQLLAEALRLDQDQTLIIGKGFVSAHNSYRTKEIFVDTTTGVPSDSDQVTGHFLQFINESHQLENTESEEKFSVLIYIELISFFSAVNEKLNTFS